MSRSVPWVVVEHGGSVVARRAVVEAGTFGLRADDISA